MPRSAPLVFRLQPTEHPTPFSLRYAAFEAGVAVGLLKLDHPPHGAPQGTTRLIMNLTPLLNVIQYSITYEPTMRQADMISAGLIPVGDDASIYNRSTWGRRRSTTGTCSSSSLQHGQLAPIRLWYRYLAVRKGCVHQQPEDGRGYQSTAGDVKPKQPLTIMPTLARLYETIVIARLRGVLKAYQVPDAGPTSHWCTSSCKLGSSTSAPVQTMGS